MQCHQCGNAVTSADRFCGACGASLRGVTDPTRLIESVDPTPVDSTDVDGAWEDVIPVWAPTGEIPLTEPALTERPVTEPPLTDPISTEVPSTSITDSLPTTEPITEVWTHADRAGDVDSVPTPTAPDALDAFDAFDALDAAPTTDELPPADGWAAPAPTQELTPSTAEMPVFPTAIREQARFRPTVVTVLSAFGAIVTLIATFATIVSVTSSERLLPTDATPAAFRTGTWITDDLAGNLSIAALIAVGAMVAGGVAAGFGWRGGSGLAAGAGLAVAGLAALVIGLAQVPIDAAYQMAAIPSDQQFTLTITRDVGYWLQIAAGAIGIVVFFAAINDAFGDRRPGLNPWIAALGALAGLVLAGGPLLPEGLAVLSDNWYVSDAPGSAPSMLLSGRLIQLAVLALTSVVGFLTVRRWGLGLAIGGGLPACWLVLSTLFDLTDRPAGPGYRNPGATDFSVHGVTIIGASALAAFAVLALVAAYDQSRRW